MSDYQEKVYENKEANDFFLRSLDTIPKDNSLRKTKLEIANLLADNINFKFSNKNILEIGCFIGDLLSYFKENYQCNVTGIEPSSLACEYSQKKFGLKLINSTFNKSKYFNFKNENNHFFDVIIIDDVLSWVSRQNILPTLASIDWLLKPGGILFIRDFAPHFSFAYPNHHVNDAIEVYNYKSMNGHKQFFLQTGMYLTEYDLSRVDTSYQKKKISRPDSAIWSDVILRKLENPLHPRMKM